MAQSALVAWRYNVCLVALVNLPACRDPVLVEKCCLLLLCGPVDRELPCFLWHWISQPPPRCYILCLAWTWYIGCATCLCAWCRVSQSLLCWDPVDQARCLPVCLVLVFPASASLLCPLPWQDPVGRERCLPVCMVLDFPVSASLLYSLLYRDPVDWEHC